MHDRARQKIKKGLPSFSLTPQMESFAIRSQLVLLGTSHTIHSSAILNRKEHLQPKASHPGWVYLLRKVGALSQHQLQSRFPKLSSGCRLSNPRHRFIAASFWCKSLSLGRDPSFAGGLRLPPAVRLPAARPATALIATALIATQPHLTPAARTVGTMFPVG